jgi:hypothetical protein
LEAGELLQERMFLPLLQRKIMKMMAVKKKLKRLR